MTRTKTLLCVCLVAALAACGKKDEGGGGGGGGKPDEADKFLMESVQKDIAAIKEKLAAGEDAGLKCAGAGSYGEQLMKNKVADAEAMVKELTKLCSYDVPLTNLETATKKAEEGRKAKPDDTTLSECYSAEHDSAVEELKKGGFDGDDKVKALAARWDAACPPKKE